MRFFSESLAKVFDVWHRYISPALPAACRHVPTCSEYAAESLRRHGLVHGMVLALGRMSRCHPWGSSGYDPVPTVTKEPCA